MLETAGHHVPLHGRNPEKLASVEAALAPIDPAATSIYLDAPRPLRDYKLLAATGAKWLNLFDVTVRALTSASHMCPSHAPSRRC